MDAVRLEDLSRKGLLRHIARQNEALLTGQRELFHQSTLSVERIAIMLNKNEQDVVDAVNASTNKVGDAISLATRAISDLFANKSSITLADVQPKLDALNSAADALKQIATDDDPAVNSDATPITVTTPEGETQPVSDGASSSSDLPSPVSGQPGDSSVSVSKDTSSDR